MTTALNLVFELTALWIVYCAGRIQKIQNSAKKVVRKPKKGLKKPLRRA